MERYSMSICQLEKDLYNYKHMEQLLETMRGSKLEAEDGVAAINCDKIIISRTNVHHSITESSAITNIERKKKLDKDIAKTEQTLKTIDRMLDELTDKERVVITRYYIDTQSWCEIAKEIKKSERTCRYVRNRALYKMLLYK